MPNFSKLRFQMIRRYKTAGYIKTDSMEQAMLAVRREEFMDLSYKNYAYNDQPFPIPGNGMQTISAPYMYPIFYEPLELSPGDRILEIGGGSGYGAALAWEMVKPTGLVVSIEINPTTYQFAKNNLLRAGYKDVILLQGDGSLGHVDEAPYDAICITAATPKIPPPLIDQLRSPGRLMAPIGSTSSLFGQDLVLYQKNESGKTSSSFLMKVSYVPLTGIYGWNKKRRR